MDILTSGAAALGVTLDAEQRARLGRYQVELIAWNAHTNLSAIRDPHEIEVRHFLDALTCLSVLPSGVLQLVDVGSGAGFPGLVLKIVRPELAVTLIDATGKKTAFLEHVVATLGLHGVTVVHARAEDAGQDPIHRERYDWAVARAVAKLNVLAEYLLPLVRVGGYALAQKGRAAAIEAAQAGGALAQLGGRLAEVRPVVLPGAEGEERALVLLEKCAPTPRAYPRRPGLPAKRPLA